MALSVKIEGTAIADRRIARNGISIKDQSSKKHSLSIALHYTDNEGQPAEGQDIQVLEGSTVKFGGIIKSVAPVPVTPEQGADADLKISITSDGYNSIPRRRTIDAYYTDSDWGTIVESLVDDFLSDEGITKGTISTGATVDLYNAKYKSIKEILDDAADASGYTWDIDNDKQLNFIAPTTPTISAYTLEEDDGDHFNMKPKRSIGTFRNKQYVEGGVDSTGTIIRVVVENSTDIAARAAAEGNSGVYGNVYRDTNIQTTADATAVAEELLYRYGKPASFTVSTYSEPPVGEIIDVTYAKYGIAANTKYLVTAVTTKREEHRWLYTYTAEARDTTDYSGKARDNAVDFFSKLAKRNQTEVEEGDTDVIITEVSNDSAYTAFTTEQALDGIDIDFKEDTAVNFQVRADLAASVAAAYTVKVRVDGTAVSTGTWYMPDTNKDMRIFTGTFSGIEVGTKTVDVTLTPASGNGTILTGEYQLSLILSDVVAEAEEEASGPTDAYAYGGDDGSNEIQDCDAYNPSGNTWTNKTDIPSPARERLCASTIGLKGYIYGGATPSLTRVSDCDEYDPSGDSWLNKTDMSIAIIIAAASTIDLKGYVYGGSSSSSTYSQNNQEYDQSGDSWNSKTNMPTPGRNQLGASTIGSKGYTYGGDIGPNTADCDEYDPSGDSWANKADLPGIQKDMGATTIDSKGYSFGGSVTDQACYQFDASGNTWATKTSLPAPGRDWLTASTVELKGYAYGGDGGGELQDCDEYDPSGDSWANKIDMPTPARRMLAGSAI